MATPLPKRGVRQVNKKKRTNKKFKFRVEIDNFEMDDILLDLGSYVNIFPNNTWEKMGKPKLVWSLIQLRLVN